MKKLIANKIPMIARVTSDEVRRAREIVENDANAYRVREQNGKNWPFHFQMLELKKSSFTSMADLPNLEEIDAGQFAAHSAVSGSYPPSSVMTFSTRGVDGIPYTRYSRGMMVEVASNAGRGVCYLAVPADDADWQKSQHNIVPMKLRHWSFCICDHTFEQVAYRMCNTTYSCIECDWTYEVDSSG